ncbi:unnamed protein product [Parascedosporium putredinis]|uniref:Haloacid dehalogenase n=1 Tax=Parascedosporium putredinis TaxID=1442378 RepID=A0A9P1GZ84_9PEZI|nr:unnamed protein product [Parascedosporium putredinis]CAI7990817.1 unnamed protein product [Parascedosporium putredinis]
MCASQTEPSLNSIYGPKYRDIKALVFDVFGTCVDWRTTVVAELQAVFASKAEAPELPDPLRQRLQSLTRQDWEEFAQKWRMSYGEFTSGFVLGRTPWKDVDAHHYDSLTRQLSLVWHRLGPWKDSVEGLRLISEKYPTATLSNGNPELLRDLNGMLEGGFRFIISAADFHAYKPNPIVYNGAASKLGLATEQVAMVAAHVGDLEAARGCGMKTIYVERPKEEDSPAEDVEKARDWVDLWIPVEGNGFVDIAKHLRGGE